MNLLLNRFLWLAAAPPVALCLAVLILASITIGSCNPLYATAPLGAEAAEDSAWAKILAEVDRATGPFAASLRRGDLLGVCDERPTG